MIVLLVFAVLAGAGTALSPCVLPVLPALLSASGVGGRRRPLGIVIGLSVTFTVTIVGMANVVGGIGLGSDPLRDLVDRGAAGVRREPADARAVGPDRGAALAAGALRRPAREATASCSGLPRRGGARVRLHALRLADPRGGHLRQRRHRADDHRSRSPTRPDRPSSCSGSLSEADSSSTGPPGGPGTHAAAVARRRDGRHRDRARRQPGRRTSTSSWPGTSPT